MKEFSVLNHNMVPEHILLTEDEVKALLEKYHITKGQLPKIKTSDPACKEINAKAGDILKVVRDSLIAGKALSYRLVIEG
ncbi:MAG: DNA-directed RNA polymerase subunit H [Methanocellales archaeon]|nr:DNA-directed RNA polymerase subunit H [Methanocellales archaeon]MDD3291634.1 DNA-directed RNA polymerase subunit H [Methanocellales archaeon]MDD5235203.1 DNA-directed RNA polymerase subunit H [Methanocellales archaeon]MDD5485417.1 DNA-directed RNA polymerase subunit H [Methanocellales archaeon]